MLPSMAPFQPTCLIPVPYTFLSRATGYGGGYDDRGGYGGGGGGYDRY